MRTEVTNAPINEMLERGVPYQTIAIRLSVSYGVVWRTAKGLRKPPSTSILKRIKANQKKQLCSCCGKVPVAKSLGLRWLCSKCYYQPQSGLATECPNHINL